MVEVNKHGVNAKIEGHILSDDVMKRAGFTDKYYAGTEREQDAGCWHMHKFIEFPKERCYRNFEVVIYIKIPKDSTDTISIEVLDDDFMQPYDYQYILQHTPEHKTANIVKEQVEQLMQQLCAVGIITGWLPGMYI